MITKRHIILSIILFVAGVVHLVTPEVFLPAMPKFIPFHIELIYLTGVLEIIFAILLLIKRFTSLMSTLIGIYFILLLPIHIYVSIYNIPMFGVSSSTFLWGRTIFQFYFIHWAFSLKIQ